MSKVSIQGDPSGSGTFTIAAPNSNNNRTLTLPDASGTVAVQGGAISGTTGTFTGLLDISAAGAGQIQFPATQNPSANANTLDDYEEGTFTPSWQSTGASFTYDSSYRHGRYTKIGNTVYFSIYISTSGAPTGTTSNNLIITGLPFISGDTDHANACGCSYGLLWNVDWPANKIMANVYVPRNSAIVDMFWEQDSTTSARWTASNLLASCYIVVTGFYFV